MLLAAGAVAAGCASVSPTHYYLLDPGPLDAGAAPAASDVQARDASALRIGIEPIAVAAAYDRERIAYRPPGAGAEIGYYRRHQWAAPPGRLLREALAEGLRGVCGSARIEPAVGAGYDLLLVAELNALEEVDRSSDRFAGRISLTLSLRAPDDARALWSARLDAAATTADARVPAVVDAINRALGDVLTQAHEALEAALRERSVCASPG